MGELEPAIGLSRSLDLEVATGALFGVTGALLEPCGRDEDVSGTSSKSMTFCFFLSAIAILPAFAFTSDAGDSNLTSPLVRLPASSACDVPNAKLVHRPPCAAGWINFHCLKHSSSQRWLTMGVFQSFARATFSLDRLTSEETSGEGSREKMISQGILTRVAHTAARTMRKIRK